MLRKKSQTWKGMFLFILRVLHSKTSVIVLGILALLCFILAIGGWGVVNDLEKSLAEMQNLEERGLLENPPVGTSKNVLYEISQFKSSSELEQYIAQHIESATTISHWSNYLACAFLATLLIKICMKIYKMYSDKKAYRV